MSPNINYLYLARTKSDALIYAFYITLDNGLKAIAKKSTTLHLTLGENHMSEKQTCANIFLGIGLP